MARQTENNNRLSSYQGGEDKMERRRNHHYYQKQSRFVEQVPNELDGQDGDIVYIVNKENYNKVEQLIKHNGRWINLSSGRPQDDTKKQKRFVQARAR